MRVLLVTNVFPPEIGGPATFIDALARALAARSHQVTVLCSSARRDDPGDAQRPFRVVRIEASNRYRYEVEVRARLARALATHRDVVVNGLEGYVAELASRLRRRVLLKIVGDAVWETARNQGLTTAGFDEFQASGARHPHLDWLRRRRAGQLAMAHRIVTPSEHLRDAVIGWGADPARVSVVPNGVAPSVVRAPVRDPSEPLRAGFVGRLVNWKGVETALLALAELPHVLLTVVGDGPERPLLELLASHLRIGDRVSFTGRLSHERTLDELSTWHAIVLPSSYEGMSHTLLEASARGVVPIASGVGGNREVVTHGRDGLLVPYGDMGALRDALASLAGAEERRRILSAAAVRNADRFPFSTTTTRTLELIEAR